MAFNPHVIEISSFMAACQSNLDGARLERVFIPKHQNFQPEYLTDELCFQWYSRENRDFFIYTLFKPNSILLGFSHSKELSKSSTKAHLSPFMQLVKKLLEGKKLIRATQSAGERALTFQFGPIGEETTLKMLLIPARPTLWLEDKDGQLLGSTRWNQSEAPSLNQQSTPKLVRPEIRSFYDFKDKVDDCRYAAFLSEVHFADRLKRAKSSLEKMESKVRKALTLQHKASDRTDRSDSYLRYAELLKANLHEIAQHRGAEVIVTDWSTMETHKIPLVLGLNAIDSAQIYFQKAKDQSRKQAATLERIESLKRESERLQQHLRELDQINALEWQALSELEQKAQLGEGNAVKRSSKDSALREWSQFYSQEKLPILVGRSKSENLNLTMRVARGNDLWFHLQGLPSPHVVVSLQAKQSASLDTLLDAAVLCLYFSKYRDSEGTFEVDYTFRKYVKRIPGSDEVSYTQNKTLSVKRDDLRLKRLLNTTNPQTSA